jgi:hypothetical protein
MRRGCWWTAARLMAFSLAVTHALRLSPPASVHRRRQQSRPGRAIVRCHALPSDAHASDEGLLSHVLPRDATTANEGEELAVVEIPATLSRPTSLVKLTTAVTSSSEAVTTADALLSYALTLLAAAALFELANHALVEWEWMQAWRYTWPGVGAIYVYEGLRPSIQRWQRRQQQHAQQQYTTTQANHTIGPPTLVTRVLTMDEKEPWLQVMAALAGAGLLVGGAADAFLPVYVTGPEFLTAAGLAPDTAAFLAGLQCVTLWQHVQQSQQTRQPLQLQQSVLSPRTTAAHALLLAQLAVLGAGAVHDVLAQVSSTTAAAIVL